MTPETKAKELIEKFHPHCGDFRNGSSNSTDHAKACALICVEEILEFMRVDDEKHECCSWANSPEIAYWYKVKEYLTMEENKK